MSTLKEITEVCGDRPTALRTREDYWAFELVEMTTPTLGFLQAEVKGIFEPMALHTYPDGMEISLCTNGEALFTDMDVNHRMRELVARMYKVPVTQIIELKGPGIITGMNTRIGNTTSFQPRMLETLGILPDDVEIKVDEHAE